jgi:hypothetical protein
VCECFHRYFAMGEGRIRPIADRSWNRLNDGLDGTTAMTHNICKAYMELDLGEERLTNLVRVVHRFDGHRARSNGVTLFVMNGQRKILFEYTFNGLSNQGNPLIEFMVDKSGRLVQPSGGGDGSAATTDEVKEDNSPTNGTNCVVQ